MVERMDDVPAGVIGLRASGKLTKEDYTEVLEPALKEAMDSGEARVIFVLTDFDGLDPRRRLRGHQDGARRGVRPSQGMEAADPGDRCRLGREGDADVRLGDAGRVRGLRRPRQAGRGQELGCGVSDGQRTVSLPSRLPSRSMSTWPEIPGTEPELVYLPDPVAAARPVARRHASAGRRPTRPPRAGTSPSRTRWCFRSPTSSSAFV